MTHSFGSAAARTALAIFLASLLASLVSVGCAGTKEQPGGGGGAGGGGSGVAARNGAATDGPPRAIGADAIGDAACATAMQKAEQVPLDLYIMMDSSESMSDPTATGQTKWDAVRGALTAFFQDPQSAGLGVGIQYFPLVQATAPVTCEADAACGNFGPCGIVNACSLAANVTPCGSDADCVGMGTCVRLGVCGASGGYCAPAGVGSACSALAGDGCLEIPGYCDARDSCDVPAYAMPAVDVATLPGAATALVASLTQHMPDGLTPTAAALSGAISHAQARARVYPTHRVAVLLATDGEPSECTPDDIPGVAQIAAAGFAGTPAISTYVIGVFGPDDQVGSEANLNMLAAAGGTRTAFIINTNQDVEPQFVTALNTVRSSGLSCQFAVPTLVADGGQIDYYSVNVEFTTGSGQTVTIGNVKNRASCSATQGGWYYDVDPTTGATPRTISICDTSCNQLKADVTGQVNILLGCKTIIVVG
jgi:hypothetical protein